MLQCIEISDLTSLLRTQGDQILDASTKLTLSNTLLSKINHSLREILNLNDDNHEFNVKDDGQLDLIYIYDFIQKTIALKLLPDVTNSPNTPIDIQLFKNLRLLEVHRLSANLIRGLKYVRSQLEYITCVKQSVSSLGDVLENCGADMQRGHVWQQLLSATFSHNGIANIDRSLEFTPSLKSLDLSHNCIRSAYLMNCLPNLECLNLASNKLDVFPNFTGSICSRLKVLILSNNLIEDIFNLATLARLETLDLSYNCLIDHQQLLPLSHLATLSCLCLKGNPLSYHKQHRLKTASYLHINVSYLTLDGLTLSKNESQQIGGFLFLKPAQFLPVKSSPAHDSAISVSISNETHNSARLDIIVDVHRSENDKDSVREESAVNRSRSVSQVMSVEALAMQDSGFEPGPGNNTIFVSPTDSIVLETLILPLPNIPPPPPSRTVNTIFPRSASSLNDLESKQIVINCDSDIEILSNPSQCSIEVLSVTEPHNISANLVPSMSTLSKKTKKCRNKEAHRSL